MYSRRGLIPAHAGKTLRWCSRWRRGAAHPRSRGENTLIRADDKEFKGSSPLTRGKQPPPRPPRPPPVAHPRSRGENLGVRVKKELTLGSSPLTRGKPVEGPRRLFERGLIPAHAGKTQVRMVELERNWAHPRSRGENE